MALKGMKNRSSRRVPAARRYKIIKKIATSKRKKEKEAAKLPKRSVKQKLIQIPNICPFKEEILKDVEAHKEDEKRRREERFALEKLNAKKKQTIESIAASATERGNTHVDKPEHTEDYQEHGKTKENSLKSYYKEFKKVVEAADVIVEVCDARDPIGTRCAEVAEIIRGCPGQKKHVLLLNKCDLISHENLEKWLKYLKKFGPVIPFKASTQAQKKNIGRQRFRKGKAKGQDVQSSTCIGADLLMSLLANYSRNKDMKTSIRVGVVGIPNVGKSSLINSLKRRRACQVGANPGITRTMQEVEIDSNIKIIDSPGIIFQRPKDQSEHEFFALKNAQHINTVQDPFSLARKIIGRATTNYFTRLYDITEYKSPEEFLAKKAIQMGKLIRGGVPDVRSAARSVIHDWNTGKIKYCTQPPVDDSNDIHLSASIVTSDQKEFQIDNLDELEQNFMKELNEQYAFTDTVMDLGDVMTDDSKDFKSQPVAMKTGKASNTEKIIEADSDDDMEEAPKSSKRDIVDEGYDTKKMKKDPIFRIKGNQSLNKNIKSAAKKMKKGMVKREKKISNVADALDKFSI